MKLYITDKRRKDKIMIVYLDYDEQVGEWYVTLENNEGDMIEVFSHFDRDCALAVANKYVVAGCATLVDGCEIIPYSKED